MGYSYNGGDGATCGWNSSSRCGDGGSGGDGDGKCCDDGVGSIQLFL